LPAKSAWAEEALVPQRPEMAHWVRGSHQRGQAPAWSQPLPLSRRERHEALGRSRHHRSQPDQQEQCHIETGEAGEPVRALTDLPSSMLLTTSPRPTAGAIFCFSADGSRPKGSFLLRKVASRRLAAPSAKRHARIGRMARIPWPAWQFWVVATQIPTLWPRCTTWIGFDSFQPCARPNP